MMSWPQLLHISENHKGKAVGYVLSKMEEDATIPHGHITSLAVLKTHRKCGLASQMMRLAHTRIEECFDGEFCSLHVRYTNRAAFHLYSSTLSYKVDDIERGYYADGEDAYDMKCHFKNSRIHNKKSTDQSITNALNNLSIDDDTQKNDNPSVDDDQANSSSKET